MPRLILTLPRSSPVKRIGGAGISRKASAYGMGSQDNITRLRIAPRCPPVCARARRQSRPCAADIATALCLSSAFVRFQCWQVGVHAPVKQEIAIAEIVWYIVYLASSALFCVLR